MARESFMLQIHHIQDELLLMGGMVEESSHKAIEALRKRDVTLAKKVYARDQLINEKRYAIESAVLVLIATQQPLAHDLRLLAAMLEIAAELERMGDYAKGNCRVVFNLGDFEIPIPIAEIEAMESQTLSMLHRALTAFIDEDINAAKSIPLEDDKVDLLYKKIQNQVVDLMVEDRELIDHANLLLWIAHNLERMADRVTNICERTVFVVTGELFEMESKKRRITKK